MAKKVKIEGPKWKAVSSSTWHLNLLQGFDITVTRHIAFQASQWVMHCQRLDIKARLLANEDIDDAKLEALVVVRVILKIMTDAVEKIR